MKANNYQRLWRQVEEFFQTNQTGSMVLSLLKPEAPYNRGRWVSALVAASSMVCIAALSGMALVALGILLMALFLLSIILTRVMGIDIGFPDGLSGF